MNTRLISFRRRKIVSDIAFWLTMTDILQRTPSGKGYGPYDPWTTRAAAMRIKDSEG